MSASSKIDRRPACEVMNDFRIRGVDTRHSDFVPNLLGTRVALSRAEFRLIIQHHPLTPADVSNFRASPIVAGLTPIRHGTVITLDTGCGVFEAPFTPHVPGAMHLPDSASARTSERRLIIQIDLIDAATGETKALRAATLTPELTNALFQFHEAAAKQPPDTASDWDRAVNEVAARHPTAADLHRAASVRGVLGT